VIDKIIKFFKAYDASRDLNILLLKNKLENKKKGNKRLRTFQAFDYAEKVEIENLFLDCIDLSKRDHFKSENSRPGITAAKEKEEPATEP